MEQPLQIVLDSISVRALQVSLLTLQGPTSVANQIVIGQLPLWLTE